MKNRLWPYWLMLILGIILVGFALYNRDWDLAAAYGALVFIDVMTIIDLKTKVKLKRLHPDAVLPKYAKELDAGFDLYAIEDTIIRPGESAKIRTGIAIALPPGRELQIIPRSGVSAKTKLRLSNAPGTIDAGYRGEVCVLIDNSVIPSETYIENALTIDHDSARMDKKVMFGTYLIRKGDRIAQGVLSSVLQAEFEVVDELDETDRGDSGFGSSGTR